MSIFVRNWRDQVPYVGHISALVWTLYRAHDNDETPAPDVNRLHGITSFVKHGLQGHQHSDHHQHADIEQLYFILRGRGQLIIGDNKVDVQEGTAVYMPVNVPHQAFNEGEGWMEHLIVSCPLSDIRGGTPALRNWRDVHPVVLAGGTIAWPLLQHEEMAAPCQGGVLQRIHNVTRHAVQGRHSSTLYQLDTTELIHYVLNGHGVIEDLDGKHQIVTEGSAVHVLPGTGHQFINQSEGWFEYVTFAVEIEENIEGSVVDEHTEGKENIKGQLLGNVTLDQVTKVKPQSNLDRKEEDTNTTALAPGSNDVESVEERTGLETENTVGTSTNVREAIEVPEEELDSKLTVADDSETLESFEKHEPIDQTEELREETKEGAVDFDGMTGKFT